LIFIIWYLYVYAASWHIVFKTPERIKKKLPNLLQKLFNCIVCTSFWVSYISFAVYRLFLDEPYSRWDYSPFFIMSTVGAVWFLAVLAGDSE